MCFDFKTRQSYVHIWSLNREFWCSIGQIHHESLEDLIATVKTDADLLGKTVAAVCSWSKTFLLKLGRRHVKGLTWAHVQQLGQGKAKGKPSLSGNQRIESNCHSTISRWCLHQFGIVFFCLVACGIQKFRWCKPTDVTGLIGSGTRLV